MSKVARIKKLKQSLTGLSNDAHYWDLVGTYGEFSSEVLGHLESCARIQSRGENHT